MSRRIAIQARVTGRVQGVAFRAWTRGQALKAGVDGWVCNNPDGSVSALLVGPEEPVQDMVDALWSGPGAAAVRDVASKQITPVPEVSGFEITG